MKTRFLFLLISVIYLSCEPHKQNSLHPQSMSSNPVVYFEIPVTDMSRAIGFYQSIFGFQFDTENFDGNEMAYFPFSDTELGITGALAKGEIYKPTQDGVLLYLFTPNIEETLTRAKKEGAEVLYPATFHKEAGFAVAEIKDSEGNRIGLHQKL